MRFSSLLLPGLAAVKQVSAAVVSLRSSAEPTITVHTSTTSSNIISRTHPDTLAPLVDQFGTAGRALNITCYAYTTMWDRYGVVGGSGLWLGFDGWEGKPDGGRRFVGERMVQESHPFTSLLPLCTPSLQHAAVTVPLSYTQTYHDAGGREKRFLPCFEDTNTAAPVRRLLEYRIPEITCYTEGQNVQGNSTWARALREECWVPGGWGGETFGVARGC